MSTPSQPLTTAVPATTATSARTVSEEQQQALDYTRSILGQIITCTLDDGRTVRGKFLCIDRLQNIILTNVVEQRRIQTSNYQFEDSPISNDQSHEDKTLPVQRHLGQAMVPGSRLVKVEIAKSIHEEKMNSLSTNR